MRNTSTIDWPREINREALLAVMECEMAMLRWFTTKAENDDKRRAAKLRMNELQHEIDALKTGSGS